MDARADGLLQHGKVFPKAQALAKVTNCGVPGVDFSGSSRFRQPSRESLFTAARSRRAEQFKQRPSSKEVKVM